MNEDSFNGFDEEEFSYTIDRYREMLKRNKPGFFDVFEFENIIEYFLDHKNFDSAKSAAQLGLQQHPSATSIQLKYANILIENGKPSEGLSIIRRIEMLENSNFELFLFKGLAYNMLDRQDLATPAFEKAIQLASDNRNEVVYTIAQSYLQLNNLSKAIKYLKLAYELEPDNILYLYELALCYERGGEFHKSISCCLKYIDNDPFSENIWFNLGMLYSSVNSNKKALEAYDFAIAINPKYISAYFNKASIFINTEEYHKAVDVYKEMIKLEEDNAYVYLYLAECYEKLNDYKKAVRYYKIALRYDNQLSDAWFGIGLVHYNQRKYIDSEYFLKKALKIDPENPEYWFLIGEVYDQLDLLDKASGAFKRTVELDPNDYEAWMAYAKLKFDNSDVNSAIGILNRAYKFNQDVSSLNYRLAAYYLTANRGSEARRYFERALSLNFPEHQEVIASFPKIKKSRSFNKLIHKYKKHKK